MHVLQATMTMLCLYDPNQLLLCYNGYFAIWKPAVWNNQ